MTFRAFGAEGADGTVGDEADAPVVHLERRGRIAVIALDRPLVRNAVDGPVARQLDAHLNEFEADPELWVGVLTGAGETFCAGADLRMIAAGRSEAVTANGFAGLTARVRTKPLIAAVEGSALAGGFELVLACDLVVAGVGATFGLPEVKRALLAAAGGLVRLPHRLPRSMAMELALTGEAIDSARAAAAGLLARVVPDGSALDAAFELAEGIAANPPVAVQCARAVVETSAADGEAAGWERRESAMATVGAAEDFTEGPRSFLEKRAPDWSGR